MVTPVLTRIFCPYNREEARLNGKIHVFCPDFSLFLTFAAKAVYRPLAKLAEVVLLKFSKFCK